MTKQSQREAAQRDRERMEQRRRAPPPEKPPEPSQVVPTSSDAPLDTGFTGVVHRAQLEQQMVFAEAHPRSIKKFLDDCLSMATLNERVASECMYALPRRDGGVVKMIEGPSARLAEIVFHAWGNCRAGARVVEEGREYVIAQGVFNDLEKNTELGFTVARRIVNKYGQRYTADMIAMTGNAACSIALRNAVFHGIPKAFWIVAYEAVRKTIAGDAQTLGNRRTDCMSYLGKMGATPEMIFRVLGVHGLEDIGMEELTQLRMLATSIKDGELTVEEAFNPAAQPLMGVGGAKQALAENPNQAADAVK